MTTNGRLVLSDPEIMGGTPCFAGTRVPVRAIFDYLSHTLDEFLDDFPTVNRDHALAMMTLAAKTLGDYARSA
jgi:uncharacterized protein (DUF433 family)